MYSYRIFLLIFFERIIEKFRGEENRNPMKQKNLVHICSNTPLNSFSENEGECAKNFLPLILGSKSSEMEGFCKLRKENDGKIIERAGKSGKLFCSCRRSSGIIFYLVCKIVEMFVFSKTPSNGK